MKATKTLGIALAALLLPHLAIAETWLTLEASEYPPEVKKVLYDVRSECKEAGNEVVDDPQAGVTIIDLDRDGSKDILVEVGVFAAFRSRTSGHATPPAATSRSSSRSALTSGNLSSTRPSTRSGSSAPPRKSISVSWHYRSDDRPMPRSFGQRVRFSALLEARPLGLGPNTLISEGTNDRMSR